MINVKSKSELEKMRKAGVITANALHYGGQQIKVGMSTYELDKLIHDYIIKTEQSLPAWVTAVSPARLASP